MKPVNNKILVRVDMAQKDHISIGGITVRTALPFEHNYREKSPVVGVIVEGNPYLKEGQIAIFHHNHFYAPSPYHLMGDLYSVPFNKTVFGVLNENGGIIPMCGNIMSERVLIEYEIPVPVEQRKTHLNRVKVINAGLLPFKPGQLIFHRPNAAYDIVYNWNGIEKRVTKIHEDMVVGMI